MATGQQMGGQGGGMQMNPGAGPMAGNLLTAALSHAVANQGMGALRGGPGGTMNQGIAQAGNNVNPFANHWGAMQNPLGLGQGGAMPNPFNNDWTTGPGRPGYVPPTTAMQGTAMPMQNGIGNRPMGRPGFGGMGGAGAFGSPQQGPTGGPQMGPGGITTMPFHPQFMRQ